MFQLGATTCPNWTEPLTEQHDRQDEHDRLEDRLEEPDRLVGALAVELGRLEEPAPGPPTRGRAGPLCVVARGHRRTPAPTRARCAAWVCPGPPRRRRQRRTRSPARSGPVERARTRPGAAGSAPRSAPARPVTTTIVEPQAADPSRSAAAPRSGRLGRLDPSERVEQPGQVAAPLARLDLQPLCAGGRRSRPLLSRPDLLAQRREVAQQTRRDDDRELGRVIVLPRS